MSPAILPDTGTSSPNAEQALQVLLQLHYRQLLRDRDTLPTFDQIQFRVYSQNGEDGILLYIFALIGSTAKCSVEICAGEGIQCNTANLIINHGWRGLLLDGDDSKLERGRAFYRTCRDTFLRPPTMVSAWLTPDNVNDLLRMNGFTGDIDLLSLDLDGNDYWIWKALDVVQPRVVVVEYQNAWGPDSRMTQRYAEDFDVRNVRAPRGLPRAGASLAAFVELAREKGYRLVGCERLCFNAFFIKNGIGEDYFPEVPTSACFSHPQTAMRIWQLEQNRHLLPDMWQEV